MQSNGVRDVDEDEAYLIDVHQDNFLCIRKINLMRVRDRQRNLLDDCVSFQGTVISNGRSYSILVACQQSLLCLLV